MITPLALLTAGAFIAVASLVRSSERARARRFERLQAAQEAWAENRDRPSRRFRIDP